MKLSLDSMVRLRARGRCEYCRLPEAEADLPFTLDHIIARQHRGQTTLENLAFACPSCNSHKGPNLTGVDAETAALVRLFNPRTDRWADHFRWDGIRIVAVTPVGRVTEHVLALNDSLQLQRRRILLRTGWLFRADL